MSYSKQTNTPSRAASPAISDASATTSSVASTEKSSIAGQQKLLDVTPEYSIADNEELSGTNHIGNQALVFGKKRRFWGQELSIPKTTLPPRYVLVS